MGMWFVTAGNVIFVNGLYQRVESLKVPLGTMPLIDTPFQRVAVDLVGPIAPVILSLIHI